MPTHIGLPDEHAERIKSFAQSQNISMADAVGVLLQRAAERGDIPAGLPGYDILRSGDQVTLTIEGGYQRTFERALARAFATALTWFAQSKAKGGLPSAMADLAQTVSGAEQYVGIRRQGNAIKIFDLDGNERTLAPSVAAELALMIDRAAV